MQPMLCAGAARFVITFPLSFLSRDESADAHQKPACMHALAQLDGSLVFFFFITRAFASILIDLLFLRFDSSLGLSFLGLVLLQVSLREEVCELLAQR